MRCAVACPEYTPDTVAGRIVRPGSVVLLGYNLQHVCRPAGEGCEKASPVVELGVHRVREGDAAAALGQGRLQ